MAGLAWLLLATPVRAMNCRVAGGSGLPVTADVAALADVVASGQGATGFCAAGACNYDGQDGTSPTAGDVALLLQIATSGSDPAGACGSTGGARFLGQVTLDASTTRGAVTLPPSSRAASQMVSAEVPSASPDTPSLEDRAQALAARAGELARQLARPFTPRPVTLPPQRPAPTQEELCSQTSVWPGELILRLHEGSPADQLLSRAAALGFAAQESGAPGRYLLRLPRPKNMDPLATTPVAQKLKAAARAACHALSALPGVRYLHPNGLRRALATPTDPLYASSQWNMAMIRLPHARSVTLGGVTVGVLDTGIYSAHSDLSARLAAGYDFISDSAVAEDGGGRDNNPEDTSAGLRTTDISHGTHVMGVIGAATDNAVGVAGICPGCTLLPLRVLGGPGSALASIDDEVVALRWGGGLSVSGLPANANPAKVLNLSLGGPDLCYPDEQAAINELAALGVTVVAAAGNSDSATELDAPAKCNNVIAVGAVTSAKTRASYSNRHLNEGLGLVAPGGSNSDILSTTDQSPFTGGMNGTSQATPHVSGVIALMKTLNTGLTTSSTFSLLSQTAEDLGTTGTDADYGVGLLDAYKAVMAAQGLSPASPQPVADTTTLNFGPSATTATSLVQHILQDNITFSAVTATENSGGDWLSATAQQVTNTVNGQSVPGVLLTATANRAQLAPGEHTGTVTLTTNVGVVTWQVSIRNGFPFQVRALSTAGTTLGVAEVDTTTGGFALGGIGAGTPVYLLAQQDADDDGSYCETGDWCGYYTGTGFSNTPGGAITVSASADQTLGGLGIAARR